MIAISKKTGTFTSNPLPEGINDVVITDIAEREVPDFEDPTKKVRKIVARFVDSQGREASRFYTPSLHEKATLTKDLVGMGVFKANAVPAEVGDLETLLVNRQCRVIVAEGVSRKGEVTAKITTVTKPGASQKVVPPAKPSATATKPATTKRTPPPNVLEDGSEITEDDISF